MSFLSQLTGAAPYEGLEESYKGMTPGIENATGTATGYLSPYQQTGQQSLSDLHSSLKELSDPQAYYNKIMSGYAESPAAKFQKEQGIQTIENQSEALGLGGSGKEMKDLMSYSQGLASQGQQDYLKNILGIKSGYLSGLQGITGLGEQAGTTMGATQMTGAEDTAKLEAAQAQAKAYADAQKDKGIGSLITGALGLVGI